MKFKQKYILIISALVLSQLCFNSSINGQNRKQVQERCLYHFEDLQGKQTWTNSYNAAGLHFIDFKSSSFIEAYMGKNDGDFVNYNESNNSFNFGLRTSSYKKINKTTFFGKIDYNNFTGQDMTWSGLIYPERYLLTVADDRPAEKAKESYKLSGGISTPLTKNLFIGMLINYETANLAKRKDLRHATNLLDFEVTGGLAYRAGILNIGANYYYRKFHEDVKFSKVAEDDIIYNGYLFKGLWFGMFDTWTQDALNLSRPFTDVINGGSLQLEIVLNKLKFFNEFTYKNQEGLTGPGADRAYTKSEAEIYEYAGKVQYEANHKRHYLSINTNYTDAVNFDNVTAQERVGGVYVTYYYGLNKTFAKRSFNFNAEYEIAFGKYKCNPSFDIKAGFHHLAQMSQSSLINPFYFTQDMKINSGYLKAKKNFLFSKGMIDISLLGAYSKGSGNKLTQHISSTATGNISEDIIPEQQATLLNREFEYLTTGKLQGEVGLRYSHFVGLKTIGGSLYLDAKYSFTSAPDATFIAGTSANVLSLAFGYSF